MSPFLLSIGLCILWHVFTVNLKLISASSYPIAELLDDDYVPHGSHVYASPGPPASLPVFTGATTRATVNSAPSRRLRNTGAPRHHKKQITTQLQASFSDGGLSTTTVSSTASLSGSTEPAYTEDTVMTTPFWWKYGPGQTTSRPGTSKSSTNQPSPNNILDDGNSPFPTPYITPLWWSYSSGQTTSQPADSISSVVSEPMNMHDKDQYLTTIPTPPTRPFWWNYGPGQTTDRPRVSESSKEKVSSVPMDDEHSTPPTPYTTPLWSNYGAAQTMSLSRASVENLTGKAPDPTDGLSVKRGNPTLVNPSSSVATLVQRKVE